MIKSTPEEIRERFDRDVERFSNLETGQTATVDAALVLEIITSGAAATHPGATSVLDLGCGAGNYTLKLLERLPNLDATLVDLSRPMLDRARERVSARSSGRVELLQGDLREIDLGESRFDIAMAAMVLHHLRSDEEWEAVFAKIFRSLKPGGSLWVADLITHETPAIERLMWGRYGDYLASFKGEPYRDEVFAYIEREDTPRSLDYQLALLRRTGFRVAEVLHKNSCFAAYSTIK